MDNKWIFKLKKNLDGTIWYKARIVVMGLKQKEGVKIAFLHGELKEDIFMKQVPGFEASMV